MGETKEKKKQKISEVQKQSENHGVSPEEIIKCVNIFNAVIFCCGWTKISYR